MKAFVSRRSLRLGLRGRFVTSPCPLYTFFPALVCAQFLQICVLLFTSTAIQSLQATGMVSHPVLWPGTQDQAGAFPAYGQAVTGAQTQLPQQVGRQGYLILGTYGAHRRLIPAAGYVLYRRLTYPTFAGILCQDTFPLL